MTKIFHKDVSDRSEELIQKEVRFQRKAAALGLSPKILDTDFKTYIDMEHLDQMCLADMYGESIDSMPHIIKKGIYDILTRLYLECDIEYIDVTPYNFIETDDQLWIIDFGDANEAPKKNSFLKEVFRKKELFKWNSDFY
jgi:tRNA A-37 threonylcarbamoyl transferase component Bud32